ncbi:MAG: hypothetical protein J3Q66DRAFT_369419 [Benniella sp.]|nr:MAG: hypothetical protein J3Q66DRAFT_369419 [Benniella sp.]
MIEIAVQEMKENRGQQPENKKKQNVIGTISVTVKGGFTFAFRGLGWEHLILERLYSSVFTTTRTHCCIHTDNTSGCRPANRYQHIIEYFPMVTVGLVGTTPHMVSAAITSLPRLLFEFLDKDLDPTMVSEMLSTMPLFMNSSNRRIVKSALGFIKVTTISIVRPHLQEIVSDIIRWSREHKGHFKVKVRHILERLVRRFGYDDIVAFVPEADKKLLVNIKKRRERAKRKKANASEMEMDGKADEEGEETTKNSESDLSDDDDDQEEDDTTGKKTQKKSNKKKQGADAWIKEDGDTPLDSLDRTAVSRVTASHPSTQVALKVKDLSSAFKTSDGKIVIEESDSDFDEE